ncbi:DUF2231 domain-containing protein [Homoserinimonas sp. A447]
MDWVFGDLPLHPLLVHLTVVLIPVAALAVVLAAVWPAARRRLGLLPPLLALAALVMVPITTTAGTWLAERVGRTPLVDRHEALGNSILPWVIALFVVALAIWAWHQFAKTTGRARLVVSVILAAAAVAVAAGSVVIIVQIGDSGARAVWTGNFSDEPVPAS